MPYEQILELYGRARKLITGNENDDDEAPRLKRCFVVLADGTEKQLRLLFAHETPVEHLMGLTDEAYVRADYYYPSDPKHTLYTHIYGPHEKTRFPPPRRSRNTSLMQAYLWNATTPQVPPVDVTDRLKRVGGDGALMRFAVPTMATDEDHVLYAMDDSGSMWAAGTLDSNAFVWPASVDNGWTEIDHSQFHFVEQFAKSVS